MIPPLALVKLLNLTSPALPIGAFSYSQGLEWAIEEGGAGSAEAIQDWIQHLLSESICYTDLPTMQRIQTGFEAEDSEAINYWNQWMLASRETQELLAEDRAVGKALLKLLSNQNITTQHLAVTENVSFVTAWAFAAHSWGIPVHATVLGYCWSWVENQIAVACKILPLGQTSAQNILRSLMPVIEQVCETGLTVADDRMGQSLPGWAMACARHETQYSRLFRS